MSVKRGCFVLIPLNKTDYNELNVNWSNKFQTEYLQKVSPSLYWNNSNNLFEYSTIRTRLYLLGYRFIHGVNVSLDITVTSTADNFLNNQIIGGTVQFHYVVSHTQTHCTATLTIVQRWKRNKLSAI